MPNFVPIQIGDAVTEDMVFHVLNGLRIRSLPLEHWTHGAHLCAGVGLLAECGLEKAEVQMPNYIREFNEETGVENTDIAGYHHTITLFYLRTVHWFFAGRWHQNSGILATELLSSRLASRAFPLSFYSKEMLFSVVARRKWVASDLQDLTSEIIHSYA